MVNREKLAKLFENWSDEKVETFSALPESASYRRYYRIAGKNKSAIGVFNSDLKENKAFKKFTKHFKLKGFNVPAFYSDNGKNGLYLIEDLGDKTLYSILLKKGKRSSDIISYYKDSLEHLIKFQIEGNKNLDYSACYPRRSFDKQSILWDLNYFKYYFLKLTKTNFDEQLLENDFNRLADFLTKADSNYFMYRDFQSRNIMIKNDALFFIDYQGGRKGALQYDVASLLYDAKANLPQKLRNELVEFYIQQLNKKVKIKSKEFATYYYSFVLIRILQAMGAYGFRGLYEKKAHFLQSIPYAVKNIKSLIKHDLLPNGLPELKTALQNIVKSKSINKFSFLGAQDKLKVTINSFSYKQGIPVDLSGNYGGFVFDCRSLPNPGRIDKYRSLTGKNKEVKKYLDNENVVKQFLDNVYKLSKSSIENYKERKFTSLAINFGCTGGQHRSVYSAEKLEAYLKKYYDIIVEVNHTGLEKKEWN